MIINDFPNFSKKKERCRAGREGLWRRSGEGLAKVCRDLGCRDLGCRGLNVNINIIKIINIIDIMNTINIINNNIIISMMMGGGGFPLRGVIPPTFL